MHLQLMLLLPIFIMKTIMVINSLFNVCIVYSVSYICVVVGPVVAIISGGQDGSGNDQQTLSDIISSVEIFSPFATVSCKIPDYPIGRHASNVLFV